MSKYDTLIAGHVDLMDTLRGLLAEGNISQDEFYDKEEASLNAIRDELGLPPLRTWRGDTVDHLTT